jgi:putative glutamine amidotransferase
MALEQPDITRPLIGITTRLDVAEQRFYLRRYYSEALEAAGAAPVYIPLIPNREYLGALIERLDGLLLSGSNSDIDPAHYGEEPHPRLGTVISERDSVDLLLLEMADMRKLPVLAICFGMQSLNVSRGGTLYQDLEAQMAEVIKHEQGIPADRPSHYIKIEGDSALAQWAGGKTVRVNSSHHQAIKDLGRDLRVVARASDNVIEAVTDTRPDRFVLGVQWHPEIGWERDQFSQAIFARFVEATQTSKQ